MGGEDRRRGGWGWGWGGGGEVDGVDGAEGRRGGGVEGHWIGEVVGGGGGGGAPYSYRFRITWGIRRFYAHFIIRSCQDRRVLLLATCATRATYRIVCRCRTHAIQDARGPF